MKEMLSSLKIVSENIFVKDLSEGGSGNISFFLPDKTKKKVLNELELPEKLKNLKDKSFMITSTGSRFYMIKDAPEKYISLFSIDKDGRKILLLNDKNPSSEIFTHLFIYDSLFKNGQNSNCILHVHSKYSLVLVSFLSKNSFNISMEKTHTEFEVIFKRKIEIVKRIKPGSLELAKELAKKSLNSDTIILKDHGIFSYGNNLLETYDRIEVLESISKLYFLKKLFTKTF
ncbi:MAG: class II aldolase/adducin family protein [candidate division WOR-3 bacterium]|jgi:ribulose-5-phosphate 4-epimerase/fuculose-1-phosphate aldolase